MGTYDTVLVPCPKCGERQGFQTKSGPCLLNEYALEDCPADVLNDVNRHGPATCDCGIKFWVGPQRVSTVWPSATAKDNMHTTNDYINKKAPELWLIHNSDFSGEVFVRWHSMTEIDPVLKQPVTYNWTVPGEKLLTGAFSHSEYYSLWDDEKQIGQVPQHVIGRAVMLAVRTTLTRKMVNFVEQL